MIARVDKKERMSLSLPLSVVYSGTLYKDTAEMRTIFPLIRTLCMVLAT